MVDHGDYRGIPVRTLEVTDPNVKAKKMVAWTIPLSTLAMVGVLAYLALVYSEEDPFFQTFYILVMVLFGALEIIVFLFYHRTPCGRIRPGTELHRLNGSRRGA